MHLQLSKSNRRKEASREFSFTLRKGTYGLLGENGAGKSTFMCLITMVDFPKKGKIHYDGKDIFQMDKACLVWHEAACFRDCLPVFCWYQQFCGDRKGLY